MRARSAHPEHRLDTSASERRRIEDRGGEVRATAFEDGKPVGPLRVWPGGLAVSRSIGDRDGKKAGCRPSPRFRRFCSRPQPGFRIVLASDGLWDAVTVKQASACGAKLGTGPCAAALCKLAQKQKDNRDDITVMVVDYLVQIINRKSPLTSKPPWRTELEVRWPLGRNGRNGRKRYDPVQPASARRKLRVEGDAEAERVEREAIEAARALEQQPPADSTISPTAGARNARRLAELEAYERSKASAVDGDDGREEVGKGHAGRGFESSPPQKSAPPPVPKGAKGPGAGKEKKTAERVAEETGGTGRRGGDGVKSGRGGGRGGGAHEDVAAAMDGLNIEEPTRAGAKPLAPRPRIDLSSIRRRRGSGIRTEVPTPPNAASDSPVDDARSPDQEEEPQGEERARGGARLEGSGGRRSRCGFFAAAAASSSAASSAAASPAAASPASASSAASPSSGIRSHRWTTARCSSCNTARWRRCTLGT